MKYPEPRVLELVSDSCLDCVRMKSHAGLHEEPFRMAEEGPPVPLSLSAHSGYSLLLWPQSRWSPQNHGSGAVVFALSLFCKLIKGMVSYVLHGQCTWTGKPFGGGAFMNLSMDNKEGPCTLARVSGEVSTLS